MSSKSIRFGAVCAGLLLLLVVAPASTARASETKETCVKANGDAQALRLEGKLNLARPLFVQCGDPTCPALVRDDCAQRLDELERVQPTIVLEVKDANGADATGVTLVIDGQARPEMLQGRALRIDPGEHALELTAPGFAPAKRRFVLNEGEKQRQERIVLERLPVEPPPPAPIPVSVPPEPASEPTANHPNTRTLGLVVGGVGVVGVAVGSIFGALTFSSVSAQNHDCGPGPGCQDRPSALSDHSKAVTDGAVSTASFIAGGALIAGGAAFFISSFSAKSPSSTGFRLAPSVGPGTAGLLIRGEF